MKKYLSVLLAVLMIISALPLAGLTSFAATSGDFEYTILDDGTAEITCYTGTETDLIIPSKIDGYTVTSLNIDIFGWDNHSLNSVEIPDSVTNIGNGYRTVFCVCKSLKNIIVNANNKVYSSQDGVLFNKDKTVLIQYPLGSERTFYQVPNGVEIVKSASFEGCDSLADVKIPDSVTNIEDRAFYNCESLTSVEIGNGLTEIGDEVFRSCDSLTSITVNGKNKNFSSQDGVLFNNDKTELIQYPIRNEREYYSIPNGVEKICWYAFEDCVRLISVVIPDSVVEIGGYAFHDCRRLENVILGDKVVKIGGGAFEDCVKLTSIIIPDSVTSIGNYAFEATRLISITIPDSVTSIGDRVFDRCSSLTRINVDENNKYYSSQDGVLFDKDKTVLIRYPRGKEQTAYTIPDGVKYIDEWAFEDAYYLKKLIISDSVIEIRKWAFADCFSLTSVVIGSGVISIGYEAFFGCSMLTNIIIPDSVIEIGNSAFSWCDSLTSVTIGKGVTSIGRDAFDHSGGLESITVDIENTVYDSRDNCNAIIETESNALIFGCKNTIIPNSVTSIGSYAFYDCENLISILIPESVTSIGNDAFYYVSSLFHVFYSGNEEQWESIEIGYDNDDLTNATIHYGCAENMLEIRTVVEPTCTETGYTEYYCSLCDEEFQIETDIIDHTYGEIVKFVYPTCDEFGYISFICSVCGTEFSNGILFASYGHCKGELIEVIPPTCTNEGYKKYSCIICNEEYETDWVDALGHTYRTEAIAPTCTEDGYTKYTCTVCGEEYKDDWISSLGHTKGVVIETVSPTCTNDGYTEYRCSVCGEEYRDWIYSQGHTKGDMVEVVPPTCTSSGYTKYICSVCDEEFYTDWTYEEHNYSILLDSHEATCTERGFVKYRCETCDDTIFTYTAFALGHEFSNDICNRCGMHKDDCLESSHPYLNDEDAYWILEKPGAASVAVTFSLDTYVERTYDKIHIYDANDNLIGIYTGDELAGKRIVVPGDTVKIRLTSDGSVTEYGFAIKNVETDVPLELERDGIVVTEEQLGTIPSNAELNVIEMDMTDTKLIYDISLTVDGQEVQPNGNVTVKIPVPSTINGDECKIYRQEADGSYTDMNAVYQDGYMVFTTDHFSTYILTTQNLGVMLGDVNGDGNISAVDARWALQFAAGNRELIAEQQAAADVNGDGKVSAVDARWILQVAAGNRTL